MDKQNLSQEIFDTLKNRIIQWEYPPGQRLTEESLCSEFGVSRVPIREALRMLEDSKLVDKVPHRGCTVKQPDLSEIHHLYDVRLALELFAVEQLARQEMDQSAWQRLHQTWNNLLATEALDELDTAYLARQDELFHETLAQATGNRVMLELLHDINERLFFLRLHDITTVERLVQTCQQHLHVLACIQARDVTAARHAIQTNIAFGRSNVETALKEALIQTYLKEQVEFA